jgi:hypothetical protein
MPKYEEVAGKVFWAIGTLFVVVLVLGIGELILDNLYPELLRSDPVSPVPAPQVKREVSMPPLRNIRLVLDRDEVRNPGERVKNAWKECIGSTPALIGTGQGSRIEEFLVDATETDVFYFHCSSPESWKMLAGRAGLTKIREGKPVDELILLLN